MGFDMTTINFEEIRDRLNRARAGDSTTRPDAQQPLYRAPPEREEYPVEALMDLQAPVKALHYKNGAPIAMVAGAMLSTTALVTQPLYDVELPALRRKPTSLFFATVGESGERKSQQDIDANQPVFQQQDEWRKNHEMDNYLALNAIEVWDMQRRKAKRDYRREPAAMKEALDALGPRPHEPMPPQLIIEDTTPSRRCCCIWKSARGSASSRPKPVS
jgi:hypothetical protein